MMKSLASQAERSMTGVPIQLIRKELLVSASEGGDTLDRLPVYTLTFEIPSGSEFTGRAQPFEDVRIDMGEVVKMVIPNYKPKSYSMSALRASEHEFDLTIKMYPNGRASGHLNRLQIGDTTHAFGMRNLTRVRNPGSFFGGIAYGVGITEILPVARAELEKGDGSSTKVVVLWAGRTRMDLFWNDQIKEMEETWGKERFEIVYMFSREERYANLTRIRNPGSFFGGIAYGVGITEILPVARAELEKGDSTKVVVLWAGRTRMDLFWKDQIKEMEERYGKERFEIVYIFSREEEEVEEERVLYGRINKDVLRDVFETRLLGCEGLTQEDARFLVIGTKPMMRMTEGLLGDIGYPFPPHALFV
eukprot:CAMPEP_0198277088 /NCGR_PEP_ID=MMETSP1447-20131203/65663_1 /TAXON_ID=420782 /ORGANISM="Chaetoceros dichaeta, Strain CCMP1751" /LENGTH=361 /DNA_ID=CAMNT_0043972083 /DNA_START=136 /DNA_END=1222 /DNA_ORIENTATION=-